jgi:hypothetical protein
VPCGRCKNVQPGKAILFDDNAISYPAILSDMERSEYYVQAVWDRNPAEERFRRVPEIFIQTHQSKIHKGHKKNISRFNVIR